MYCRSAAASKSSSLCSRRTSASVFGRGGRHTAVELRAVLRSTVSPRPAAFASIPSPSVPSIPTETKSASGNISACSATAASRALASGTNTKLPHQKSGAGGVETTVSPPCLVIAEPPSASNMMSVRKPSDAMGTETTVAGGHDVPDPNIVTLSRGKRKPIYSEPPMPKRPRRLRTPLPRHGCDEIAAGIFTLRGVVGLEPGASIRSAPRSLTVPPASMSLRDRNLKRLVRDGLDAVAGHREHVGQLARGRHDVQ